MDTIETERLSAGNLEPGDFDDFRELTLNWNRAPGPAFDKWPAAEDECRKFFDYCCKNNENSGWIRLHGNNKIIGGVIDRFGRDIIMVPNGDMHFTIRVRVALSPIFYGWLFQFGDLCEVLEPQSLRDDLIQRAEDFLIRLKDGV